jgi:hypothetical protein
MIVIWGVYFARCDNSCVQLVLCEVSGILKMERYPWEGFSVSLLLPFMRVCFECEIVDWIHIASDKIQWWALVNTVMNILVS